MVIFIEAYGILFGNRDERENHYPVNINMQTFKYDLFECNFA